jgi:hypothetical protein
MDDEFECDTAPPEVGNGFARSLPHDAAVTVTGLRHANMRRATMCGIPNEQVVMINREFAPEQPGACPACIDAAKEWQQSVRDRSARR